MDIFGVMSSSPTSATILVVAVAAMFLLIPFAILGTGGDDLERDTLYQLNTLDAFLDGQYDGLTSYGELYAHGDTGLGTFHAVDGEMIAFGGKFYQICYNGSVNTVSSDMTAPLVMLTWFDVDASGELQDLNLSQTKSALDAMRDSDNFIYVFVAHGTLDSVCTRSFAPFDEPYPPLSNATSAYFYDWNVTGTLVVMWFPVSLSGVNLHDYHMHFLADDLSIGGHVMDLNISSMQVDMDRTPSLNLDFPETDAFRDWEFGQDDRDVE